MKSLRVWAVELGLYYDPLRLLSFVVDCEVCAMSFTAPPATIASTVNYRFEGK